MGGDGDSEGDVGAGSDQALGELEGWVDVALQWKWYNEQVVLPHCCDWGLCLWPVSCMGDVYNDLREQ